MENSDESNPLSRNLRAFRGKRTQGEVERATGLPQAAISKWENGTEPELQNLLRLLAYYRKTLDEAAYGMNANYDQNRRQDVTSSAMIAIPAKEPTKGADEHGRSRREHRTVIDLRAELKRQIEDAVEYASKLRNIVIVAADVAAKPGVLVGSSVAGPAPSMRRQTHRKGRG